MSAPGRHGETMAAKRAHWKAEGRCRGCGRRLTSEDGEGATRCRGCRSKRGRGSDRTVRRDGALLVAAHLRVPDRPAESTAGDLVISVRLPWKTYRLVRDDAARRGETVEAWIAAEVENIFDLPPPDNEDGPDEGEGT